MSHEYRLAVTVPCCSWSEPKHSKTTWLWGFGNQKWVPGHRDLGLGEKNLGSVDGVKGQRA